jgi:DNA-binding MarR family transcriptional regulator
LATNAEMCVGSVIIELNRCKVCTLVVEYLAGCPAQRSMTLSEAAEPSLPDLIDRVERGAAALVIAWGRAQEHLSPRISASQLRALLVVDLYGKTNLNQLADEIGAIPSSASRLCDRLLAAGLLQRRPGAADRREVELSLSTAGERLIEQLRAGRRAELARALAGMDEAHRRALVTGLAGFRDSVEGLGQHGPELV